MIEQLENELREELESNTPTQVRGGRTVNVDGKQIEVFARRSSQGEMRFGYSYCGVRLERRTLLTLICSEEACPRRSQLRTQWKVLKGEAIPLKTAPLVKLQVRPLFDEVTVRFGERSCVARPASFVSLTPCPVNAHSAIPMRKSGWDLFEDGKWIAGGLVTDEASKALIPMLSNVATAQDWLANRSQLESFNYAEQTISGLPK